MRSSRLANSHFQFALPLVLSPIAWYLICFFTYLIPATSRSPVCFALLPTSNPLRPSPTHRLDNPDSSLLSNGSIHLMWKQTEPTAERQWGQARGGGLAESAAAAAVHFCFVHMCRWAHPLVRAGRSRPTEIAAWFREDPAWCSVRSRDPVTSYPAQHWSVCSVGRRAP